MSINTPAEAIAYAQGRATSGAVYPEGNCLGFVRDAYSTGTFGSNAAAQYAATRLRGTTSPAPFGTLLWWTGGTHGYGHVALSDGKGNCYSTDFGADRYYGDGRVRLIPIEAVARFSNPAAPLVFRAWSRDLDGYTVDTQGGTMATLDADDKAYIREQAREMVSRGVRVVLIGNKDTVLDPSGALDSWLKFSLQAVMNKIAAAPPGSGVTEEQLAAELAKRFSAAAQA